MDHYYLDLELPPFSTVDAVKKQYRKLAKIYHPDQSKSQETAEKFSRACESYKKLTDEHMKTLYDREYFSYLEENYYSLHERNLLDKFKAVFHYAEKNKKFDSSYVSSLYDIYLTQGEGALTLNQIDSLDRIIRAFKIKI
ncbi:MAG: DnaJ domain-containing protein [Psychroflexus sp.]